MGSARGPCVRARWPRAFTFLYAETVGTERRGSNETRGVVHVLDHRQPVRTALVQLGWPSNSRISRNRHFHWMVGFVLPRCAT